MYEITITTIQLAPFTLTKHVYLAEDILDRDIYIRNFLDEEQAKDIKHTDLNKRYASAVKRFKAGKINVPIVYSHPREGLVLRHVIQVKGYIFD